MRHVEEARPRTVDTYGSWLPIQAPGAVDAVLVASDGSRERFRSLSRALFYFAATVSSA